MRSLLQATGAILCMTLSWGMALAQSSAPACEVASLTETTAVIKVTYNAPASRAALGQGQETPLSDFVSVDGDRAPYQFKSGPQTITVPHQAGTAQTVVVSPDAGVECTVKVPAYGRVDIDLKAASYWSYEAVEPAPYALERALAPAVVIYVDHCGGDEAYWPTRRQVGTLSGQPENNPATWMFCVPQGTTGWKIADDKDLAVPWKMEYHEEEVSLAGHQWVRRADNQCVTAKLTVRMPANPIICARFRASGPYFRYLPRFRHTVQLRGPLEKRVTSSMGGQSVRVDLPQAAGVPGEATKKVEYRAQVLAQGTNRVLATLTQDAPVSGPYQIRLEGNQIVVSVSQPRAQGHIYSP